MTEAKHGLVVKTHWKNNAKRLRQQIEEAPAQAEREQPEFRASWEAGTYRANALYALALLNEVLEAAEAAEGALPIRLTLGQYLLLDGKVLRVVNAWTEVEEQEGRTRWGIVTEDPQAPAPAPRREPVREGRWLDVPVEERFTVVDGVRYRQDKGHWVPAEVQPSGAGATADETQGDA